jgi:hypothetical protein
MSTPHDPPLSRRAARQAQQAALDAQPEAFAQPVTRRGSAGTPISVPSSAPTDVAYRTQVRPRVPHYDTPPAAPTVIPGTVGGAPMGSPSFGAEAPLAPPAAPPVAPPVAPPATEGLVRRRDFRPPAEQAPPATGSPQPPAFDTQLQYHTVLAPRGDAPPPAAPPAAPAPHVIEPPAAAAPAAAPPSEQTLSRRELRALRDQVGIGAEPTAPVAPLVDPLAPPATGYGTTVLPPSPAMAPPGQQPVQHLPPPVVPPVHQVAPPADAVVAPTPIAPPPAAPAPVASPASPSIGSAPTGSHWSVGIHADDDPFENTFSREVGAASSLTSTNALVLPEMPAASIAGPVTGTGEIIITGMIDIPKVVSSTGTVPTVHDSPDIDDLVDPGELTVAPPDAAPVSASRAVSSHTQGHPVITPAASRLSSNAITTALVASTVVMAVVAIGLFVVAAVNGLF